MSTGKSSGLDPRNISFDDDEEIATPSILKGTGGITATPPVVRTSRMTVKVDPKLCRMWRFHDRAPEWYNYEKCGQIVESIRVSGQNIPAVGRYLPADDPSGMKVELIIGGRRRWSCEYLNIPLEVEIVKISDQVAYQKMVSENAERKDVSFVERCMSTHRVWKEGLFSNQAELAVAENSTESTVSIAIRVGTLFTAESILKVVPDLISITARTANAAVMAAEKAGVEVLAQTIAEVVKSGKTVADEAIRIAAMKCKNLVAKGKPATTKSGSVKARNVQIGLGRSLRISASIEASGELIARFPKGSANVSEADLLEAVKQLLAELKQPKKP